MIRSALLAVALAFPALPAVAQSTDSQVDVDIAGVIQQISSNTGEMMMVMPGAAAGKEVTEVLRFEPWQMLDDLFRDDIVFLMRHGPTDWSKRDATNVAPGDCANQRVMTDVGKRQMYELGALMVANELKPGRILVSEWCRNQQTLDAMRDGMAMVDDAALDDVSIETIPDLNLLLSLQGAPNVTGLREIISNWDGGDGQGPMLVISHFTNIQELTEFSVYEGEMLVIDPKRNNRVLGYVRLRSASPDIGHFDESVVQNY
ncbi:histidine phosphatase family protein [Jannaschia ovalis]|uniref:Histidine phosphatase family protein n=1 Tax=Jannaschia ovalis TaxID=3038773 RepID=A0ABY8L8K9_9RHOB|nr:histidine phosphatase family protein [Jannaschia sp. GRR-S6-38]WGH77694.1 histidine phosphatase family protein [Jannaschia sp. GRR-S6-38]